MREHRKSSCLRVACTCLKRRAVDGSVERRSSLERQIHRYPGRAQPHPKFASPVCLDFQHIQVTHDVQGANTSSPTTHGLRPSIIYSGVCEQYRGCEVKTPCCHIGRPEWYSMCQTSLWPGRGSFKAEMFQAKNALMAADSADMRPAGIKLPVFTKRIIVTNASTPVVSSATPVAGLHSFPCV